MILVQEAPAVEESRLERLRRTIGLYAVAGVICLVAEVVLFELWKADLRVPMYYPIAADLYANLMMAKNLVETGSFLTFPRLGAPGILDHRDFNTFEYFHFFTLKLIASAARDPGLTINLFYLLSFFTITWTSLFVMGRLGISGPVAVVASLLYAFTPYHFMRGQLHIFLAAYFAIPLMVLLLLRLCEGKPLFLGWRPEGVRWPVVAFTVVTCALVVGSGVYAVFFSLFFLAVASLIAYSRGWRLVRLADGLSVIALVFALMLAEAVPTFLHARAHGKNLSAAKRNPEESEIFALSVSTMLRPTPYHRFRDLKSRVLGRGAPPPAGKYRDFLHGTEKHFVALGIFGAFGLAALLAVPFLVTKPPGMPPLFDPLAKLCVAGILLGAPSGLGNVVAIYLTPNIRAYNRISVFLAFFCVLATALLLDRLRRKVALPRRRRLFNAGLGVMLFFCLYDQMPGFLVPDYEEASATFARDDEFFRRVEAALPADSMVFQLPYAPYPEGTSKARESDWLHSSSEHLRAFIHSDRIRWSSPTMRGREWDRWQVRLWEEPVDRVVEELSRVGFAGISIDRDGYDDRADATIAELRRLVGSVPLESPDHRFIFFPLKPASPPASIARPG